MTADLDLRGCDWWDGSSLNLVGIIGRDDGSEDMEGNVAFQAVTCTDEARLRHDPDPALEGGGLRHRAGPPPPAGRGRLLLRRNQLHLGGRPPPGRPRNHLHLVAHRDGVPGRVRPRRPRPRHQDLTCVPGPLPPPAPPRPAGPTPTAPAPNVSPDGACVRRVYVMRGAGHGRGTGQDALIGGLIVNVVGLTILAAAGWARLPSR